MGARNEGDPHEGAPNEDARGDPLVSSSRACRRRVSSRPVDHRQWCAAAVSVRPPGAADPDAPHRAGDARRLPVDPSPDAQNQGDLPSAVRLGASDDPALLPLRLFSLVGLDKPCIEPVGISTRKTTGLTQNGHPDGWPFHKEVRRCPTLPQGPPCSTIGAESLSFRVRNVTGRFPLAMAAETLLIYVSVHSQSLSALG